MHGVAGAVSESGTAEAALALRHCPPVGVGGVAPVGVPRLARRRRRRRRYSVPAAASGQPSPCSPRRYPPPRRRPRRRESIGHRRGSLCFLLGAAPRWWSVFLQPLRRFPRPPSFPWPPLTRLCADAVTTPPPLPPLSATLSSLARATGSTAGVRQAGGRLRSGAGCETVDRGGPQQPVAIATCTDLRFFLPASMQDSYARH